MGARLQTRRGEQSRILGVAWLSQLRRPLEGTAIRGRLRGMAQRLKWQRGKVLAIRQETLKVKSLIFEVPDWTTHLAGQHVDVRLIAEDGYQAQRSYSIASPPEDPHLMLTIERIENGEVSPYLTDELRVGDQIELRGPIGGYFVWDAR